MTREEPLPHPDIKIGKIYDVSDNIYLECFDDAKYYLISGSYTTSENYIELNSYKWLDIPKDLEDVRFEVCVYVLCHELDHWAQQMFLDEDEQRLTNASYLKSRFKDECPFLERVNFFMSRDWEHENNGDYKAKKTALIEAEMDRVKKLKEESRKHIFHKLFRLSVFFK